MATASVKRPVLAGKKIAPARTGTSENTQRYSEVMNRSLLTSDPLEFARNRARQGRSAATDAVNAGRSVAPKVSGQYIASAQRVKSTAITYPCIVETTFITESGQTLATDTFEVSVPSITDDSDQIVPANHVDVALSRFRIPRGYDAVDSDLVPCSIEEVGGERKGTATIVVAPATKPSSAVGGVHTVQATPVMLVERVRFPARKPWEFSVRTNTEDAQQIREELRVVMETELRQSIPQVRVSDVIWADGDTRAEVLLEHCPTSPAQAKPGVANKIPGGEVLGVFPAGYRRNSGQAIDRDSHWVYQISQALTHEIAEAIAPVRAERGLEPLQPFAVNEEEISAVVKWCQQTGESKSTSMTPERERVLTLLGRSRCAEVLYPRGSRRGDDSVRRLAEVFVRSARKAVQSGGKSALLSERATGVTAGIVVHEVDGFSRKYELSASVMVHA